MQLTSVLLLPVLSSLVAADQQNLREKAAEWLEIAKQYLPNAAPAASPSAAEPNAAGASPAAAVLESFGDKVVEAITLKNWEQKLSPKLTGEEEWMVYMTGGNKTCFGRCGKVDAAWREAVPLLSELPHPAGSPPLHLGIVNCEKEEILCTAWAATVPTIYHLLLPGKTEPQPKTPLHVVTMNTTTTTAADIVSVPSISASRYLQYDEYTGAMHPLDGWLAQFGLQVPLGYAMWGLGNIPSWVMMLGISFLSRQIMSRRLGQNQGVPTGTDAPPAQAQTPNRPAAAAPKSGGSSKKRR